MNEPRRKRSRYRSSHKVSQSDFTPFLRRKRRGMKSSARIKQQRKNNV